MRRCIYDNLKAAVKRRLGLGQERELSGRFLALCSHYVIEPCFARPGEGHDKGGVEARGKNVRLQHLTPVPCGASLAQIAGRLVEDLDAAAAARRIRQGGTVAERFPEEQAGFIAFERAGGELLFHLISDRYERWAKIVTTNLVFGEWVRTFRDEKLTTALPDRLGHHAHVITTTGESFRTSPRRRSPGAPRAAEDGSEPVT